MPCLIIWNGKNFWMFDFISKTTSFLFTGCCFSNDPKPFSKNSS